MLRILLLIHRPHGRLPAACLSPLSAVCVLEHRAFLPGLSVLHAVQNAVQSGCRAVVGVGVGGVGGIGWTDAGSRVSPWEESSACIN
ncbi:unnamed protein product [Pleuronectes platessa]|uniref:Uncharacterized protein n=1 Tax=Pleuronectes platessa TaxID=8262 RepID=A0A9N7VHS3_PLEPL|nr:unnamed protein product [Pleuronectes platessa]